jgi:hypothetical protein
MADGRRIFLLGEGTSDQPPRRKVTRRR